LSISSKSFLTIFNDGPLSFETTGDGFVDVTNNANDINANLNNAFECNFILRPLSKAAHFHIPDYRLRLFPISRGGS
jgi:hypothetical protein